jgi:mono/diheme cytochrome c family protein
MTRSPGALTFGLATLLSIVAGFAGCGGGAEDGKAGPGAAYRPEPGRGSTSQPAPPAVKREPWDSYVYYGKGEKEGGYTELERKGRDTWIMWTGGNEKFFRLGTELAGSFGISVEYYRLLDTRDRPTRFARLGLINEPNTYQVDRPDQYGFWLDEWAGDKHPDSYPDPKVYGEPTGIVGLRKFPNPKFNSATWDPKRDPDRFFKNPASVEPPYSIGMACAFCHMAFHPQKPPEDPVEPRWENLAANLGNQYIAEGRIFFGNGKVVFGDQNSGQGLGNEDFLHHLGETQQRGTSETSRLSYDFINNPNAINSIFFLHDRPSFPDESLNPEAVDALKPILKPGDPLPAIHHVLKDGSDSQSIPIASIRVYVNIGMYGEYWIQRLWNPFNPKEPQKPFEMKVAQEKSADWRETLSRMPALEAYLATYGPMYLEKVPRAVEQGFVIPDSYRGSDNPEQKQKWQKVERGGVLFAENCAFCHSSKGPDKDKDKDAYAALSQLKDFYRGKIAKDALEKGVLEKVQAYFRDAVAKPDFLQHNSLTDDVRYPVSELKTNAARALGTNATKGHVWDEFSSPQYKALPAAGELTLYDPATGAVDREWQPPAGGRGYYRTASLVSMWATAPYLHNNSVGKFPGDLGLAPGDWPALEGRMAAFNDAIEKLFKPGLRANQKSMKVTSTDTYLNLRLRTLESLDPGLEKLGDIRRRKDALLAKLDVLNLRRKIGLDAIQQRVEDGLRFPVPEGTPINLLANLHIDHALQAVPEFLKYTLARKVGDKKLESEAVEALLKLSEYPDLIEDHGHEYGKDLSEADQQALIEYLKKL